jgi:hypothetical protein
MDNHLNIILCPSLMKGGNINLELVPHDLSLLIQESTTYGKYAKKLQDQIQNKKQKDTGDTEIDKMMEINNFYELLEDRFRKIHRNTRSNVQDCLTTLLHNYNCLQEISEELQSNVSEWKYWGDDCPICLQRIQLTRSTTIQTSPCCRKLFHNECLRRYLHDSGNCPHCRYENLSSHPLYNFFKGITPDEAKVKFDNLTSDELRNQFLNTSSHIFRVIFNDWSVRNHRQQHNIYQDELANLRQEISELRGKI